MSDDGPPRSRWQDFWDKTLPVIVGGLIAGLFAIAGSYFATTFQTSAQHKEQKEEDQRKVFARLMGKKLVTEQLHVSQLEARVFSDYNEELWRRAGFPKDALDLQEAERWMHRGEDLVFELAKNTQALFEDLGTVEALFPDTPRLRELCAPIYKFRSLTLKSPVPHDGPVEKVTQWKDQAEREIQSLAESEYGKPIDQLVAYLRTQLPQ
jgi:hypothetical protein